MQKMARDKLKAAKKGNLADVQKALAEGAIIDDTDRRRATAPAAHPTACCPHCGRAMTKAWQHRAALLRHEGLP